MPYQHRSSDANEVAYNKRFTQRIKTRRQKSGYTAEKMAFRLGIKETQYAKYESRSPMSLYLLEKFAYVTKTDLHYLVTGFERGILDSVDK